MIMNLSLNLKKLMFKLFSLLHYLSLKLGLVDLSANFLVILVKRISKNNRRKVLVLGKPVFNEDHRIEAISALELVDYVVLNNKKTAVNVIKKIRPNFYCKGSEYKKIKNDLTKEIKNELKAIKSINGQIIFTGGEVFSSSKILNMTSSFSKTHQVIIKNIKKKYSFSDIKSLIESLKNLKVLIIGETIIDQYVFCEALGKSGKESVLVLKDVYTENYLGGAAAIAKNLSNISKNIV